MLCWKFTGSIFNWLKDTGLIKVVNRVKCGNKQPLRAYEDLKAFKIYLLDVVIPVEAKAGINVKAQSLKVYMKEYNPKFAIRYSLLNIKFNNKILNIPLYAIWNTENYIEEIN